jgi:hypothetical protein
MERTDGAFWFSGHAGFPAKVNKMIKHHPGHPIDLFIGALG